MAPELPNEHAAVLRSHGLSVTAQRIAVLRAVTDNPHATADVVDAAVRTQLGAVSRQAVYDALGTKVSVVELMPGLMPGIPLRVAPLVPNSSGWPGQARP